MREWGNGRMGKWENGEMGEWGNGRMGKEILYLEQSESKNSERDRLFLSAIEKPFLLTTIVLGRSFP
jgi:hypothetical protein